MFHINIGHSMYRYRDVRPNITQMFTLDVPDLESDVQGDFHR